MTENIEFVDLGLPSGTKWMKCNIGAEKETEYGLYFQWGDTVGYSGNEVLSHSVWETSPCNVKKEISINDWDWYTMCDEWDEKNLTNKVLNNDVDAAFIHTNGKAKMPSFMQISELFNYTTHSWTVIDGIFGTKFVNRSNSNKYIFIPASGGVAEKQMSFRFVGGACCLWLNNMGEHSPYYAYADSLKNTMYETNRCYQFVVRGILID